MNGLHCSDFISGAGPRATGDSWKAPLVSGCMCQHEALLR